MADVPEAQSDGQLTIETAIANLQGEDLGLRVYAAWWLGRFRIDTDNAIEVLVEALKDEDDRTQAGGYPLRRNAARALGKLGHQAAVDPLIASLGCTDFYVREAAARALESLGDGSAINQLLSLLRGEIAGTEPAPEPPQLTQPFDALIEALGGLGAVEAKSDIQTFLDHSVPRVRYAADRALYQLTADPAEARQYGDRLIDALSNSDLQLRRAVLTDLGAIGYLPAAEAIAKTLAENSLKLIALKGILEKELSQTATPEISDGARHVMALMDDLL
ncbi:MAG: HEAT repeat domain-containing protein [Cyanobacteria bacterium P01_H01_bin.119]